jgi:glycosidase
MPLRSLLADDRPDNLGVVRELLDRARREGLPYFPSPVDWRDEVLYFLLPDRFSDGREAARPLLTRERIRELRTARQRPDWNWRDWAESGKLWQGGTINGIRGRLEYLKGLGVSTLWIGPVFKQRARLDSYHGYGIQDFLQVDPRFGTREDLQNLVKAAHAREIRIILDVIVNHSGDNWGYVPAGRPVDDVRNEPPYRPWPDHYGNPASAETGGWRLSWRDEQQRGFTTNGNDVAGAHDGAWPRELRELENYTRAGMGSLGAGAIEDPHAEHKRTDFFSLKDFALDSPRALAYLTDCYKYWIAITDCDGFRIDTVKHMSLEDTRNFCGAIREFADTLGKRNFLLVGEIAGGDFFQDYVLDNLAILKRNLSAALDIGSARTTLHRVARGEAPASEYFDLFHESSQGFESHREFGDRHVSILDDHDHVIGDKIRFSAMLADSAPTKDYHSAAATAIQLFTLGIPCIYYGTEQAFAGPAQSQLKFVFGEGWNDGANHGDRFLREAMFGPAHPRAHHDRDLAAQLNEVNQALPGFGPFGTSGAHCFDAGSPAYTRIALLAAARANLPVLRIGRQYLRQVRLPGTGFQFPRAGEIIAWSRILDNVEALCVVNPNQHSARGGDVVVSNELWRPGTEFTVVVNTGGGGPALGARLTVKGASPGYLEIRDVEPGEVLVLLKQF